MGNENVVHIHSGDYLVIKNEIMNFSEIDISGSYTIKGTQHSPCVFFKHNGSQILMFMYMNIAGCEYGCRS